MAEYAAVLEDKNETTTGREGELWQLTEISPLETNAIAVKGLARTSWKLAQAMLETVRDGAGTSAGFHASRVASPGEILAYHPDLLDSRR